MHQQHEEIHGLKVRHWRASPAQQTPREGDKPVSSVVDFPGHSPPPRGEQSCASLGLQITGRRERGCAGEFCKMVPKVFIIRRTNRTCSTPQQRVPQEGQGLATIYSDNNGT